MGYKTKLVKILFQLSDLQRNFNTQVTQKNFISKDSPKLSTG